MKTNFFSIVLICLALTSVYSQSNLNTYKYVIVSKKYDFLKEADQYQLNSLSKFLFDKYGFEAFIEGEKYPEDLIKNRCLALKADALKDPGMFKTKITIELTDCNDQVVYNSKLGESRQKEFKKAYNEALREAFESFETLNYKYEPKKINDTDMIQNTELETNTNSVEEIEKLKEEIQTLKEEKTTEAVGVKKQVVAIPVVVAQTSSETIEKENNTQTTEDSISDVLYAQEIENGFQLVDSSPKVIFKIIKTGANDVYLVEDQTAIIYKKEDKWILESSINGIITIKQLNIKF
jgi:polyhydroxyalkanoate synthesis regulator phasin